MSNIEFRKAEIADAEVLVDIYNSSFYDDYVKYGECPAYGRTKEEMEQSIIDYPKFLIISDGKPVGCISCKELESGAYEVGCLCVIPEFQGRGIGTAAMEFAKSFYSDWVSFTLVTPVDKSQNVKFYTEKCGFDIESEEMDGNVKVYRFVLKRTDGSHGTVLG
jgi:ribosomal protein S18 acetylase RimI-like enzyme